MQTKEWFETWFDSKYYHLLYNNRDQTEAKRFIDNLIGVLKPKLNARILDMGCGKGRHAIQLASKAYEVTGLDISEESILHARQYEQENLSFYTHDMRQSYRGYYYDYIFSLFTSFGYFKTMREHHQVIRNHHKGLRENGIFVIDFLNAAKIKNNLVQNEQITKENTTFNITRSIIDGYITKNITFEAEGIQCNHTERVYGFSKVELTQMIEKAGFAITEIYGDYDMNTYEEQQSNRLIIVAKK